jgi:hypothetical protein
MIIKLATSITIPMSHLKGDHKELEQMKDKAQGILNKVKEMQEDDKKAKAKYSVKKFKK